jgi:ubiquitin-protein ligase E3 C
LRLYSLTPHAQQSAAFVAGLHDIINPRWLRLFSQAELRLLVGGVDTDIDIEDLRQNTVYSGLEESSDTIRYFWDVLREFDGEERRNFIKFVTAADKAPLLGFRELQPLFAIRGAEDTTRLPTSSTCMVSTQECVDGGLNLSRTCSSSLASRIASY